MVNHCIFNNYFMKKQQKIREQSIVLLLAIVCFIGICQPIKVNASNTADEIVDIARSQIGNSDYTKYYNGNRGAWCADFVTWCAQQAGVTSIYNSSSCYYMYKNMKEKYGCQPVSSPQKGDIVFFYCNKCASTAGKWCHVGIMEDSKVSIEGNRGSAPSKVGRGSSYNHNGDLGYIHGDKDSCITRYYLRPNYGNSNNHDPQMGIGAVEIGGKVNIYGWAFDPDNYSESLDIHVYVGGLAGSDKVTQTMRLKADKYRPDVPINLNKPELGNYHGIDDFVEINSSGETALYIYAINIGTGDHTCDRVIVNIPPTDHNPKMGIGAEEIGGKVNIYGWAFDPDNYNESLDIHVYVGGRAGSDKVTQTMRLKADKYRPDVPINLKKPEIGNYHGIDDFVEINSSGETELYIYAINTGTGDHTCDRVIVNIPPTDHNPKMGIGAEEIGGKVNIYGWAFDPDNYNESLDIHVYVGGRAGSDKVTQTIRLKADKYRPDIPINLKKPELGNYHGIDDFLEISGSGEIVLYIYAINTGTGDHTCDRVIVNIPPTDHNPKMGIGAEEIGGKVHIYGWAFDPDNHNESLDIHVYVGGRAGSDKVTQTIRLKADKYRPDIPINLKKPELGNYHGIDDFLEISGSGETVLYIYAINIDTGDHTCDRIIVNIPPSKYSLKSDITLEENADKLYLKGWAFNTDNYNEQLKICIYVGGRAGSDKVTQTMRLNADKYRPDVPIDLKDSNIGDYHGIDHLLEFEGSGQKDLYVYAENVGDSDNNALLGKYTVLIEENESSSDDIENKEYHDPEGGCDISSTTGSIRLKGWVIDKDSKRESLKAHVYIGGPVGVGERHVITADAYRPDIPINLDDAELGDYHGIDSVIHTRKKGSQAVYVYAENIGAKAEDILITKGTVTIQEDNDSPIISDIKISDVHTNDFTLSFKVTDNVVISDVMITTWTGKNGEDDVRQEVFSKNGNVYTCIVKKSNHHNKCGLYNIRIYAYDYVGNCGVAFPEAIMLDHEIVKDSAKEATCTEGGKSEGSHCSICNTIITEQIIVEATGHQHTELRNAKEATCIQEGYSGDIYCKDCNTKISSGQIISKTDHNWNEGEVTKKVSCTEKGIKTYTCTRCKHTKIEEIPEVGHGNTVKKYAKAASCKTEGYTGDTYCKDCGILLEEGKVITKSEHTWDSGVITVKPTYTSVGTKSYTCNFCGIKKSESVERIPVKAGVKIDDNLTNATYKVLNGTCVEYVKPIAKKTSIKIPDTVKIGEKTYKVITISANAFLNHTSLSSIVIGNNITTIGTNVFYGCKKLGKVTGGSRVVKIGDNAFANCINLGSITIPGTVRSIGKQAFYNCKKMKTIVVKTSALTSKTIGTKAFKGTYAKATVKVPAKKLQAYKKLFKSRGMGAKAVFKK